MKYRLLDLLACPYDKHFPLVLYVFSTKRYEDRSVKFKKKPACELYCGYHRKHVKELTEEPDCEDCIKNEVEYGLLYCPECGRWYPIIDEIPILLPDEMRKKEEDIEFLKKFKDKIPEEILKSGKPFCLSENT